MDRNSIQLAVSQTLVNLQRCGLRWIADDQEIPADWQEAIESLTVGSASSLEVSCVVSASSGSGSTKVGGTTVDGTTVGGTTVGGTTVGGATVAAGNSAKAVGYEFQPLGTQPAGTSAHSMAVAGVSSTMAAREGAVGSSGAYWNSVELDDAARFNHFQILDREIRACRKCGEICPYRRQTVFGEGPIRPTVCFMGEAPGAEEDAQGRPFIGRAGEMLTNIISAMKLKRAEVYILNSLKCRPPGNRHPSPEEIVNCYPFVESQLETLRPSYIVCLGAAAALSLLKSTRPVGQMRGTFHHFRGARVLVTYHPSYLLRNASAKRLVWEDMQLLMQELGIPLPTKKQT